jgi:hypothetical protein
MIIYNVITVDITMNHIMLMDVIQCCCNLSHITMNHFNGLQHETNRIPLHKLGGTLIEVDVSLANFELLHLQHPQTPNAITSHTTTTLIDL